MCTEKRNGLPELTRQRGISFIELVMFIVIVGVGVAGILSVMTLMTAKSADPLVRKQAIAVAEALLEEIELQPFTICDPTDPAATTAAAVGDCTTAEVMGPESGESRYSLTTPYNNVNDYSGFSMASGILDVKGVPIAGLEAYSAVVTITQEALDAVPAAESLRIDVRVQGPGDVDVTLTGYRLRYAPNSI